MKKLLLLLCCSAVVLTASAQDDDLYFVPSKKSSKKLFEDERVVVHDISGVPFAEEQPPFELKIRSKNVLNWDYDTSGFESFPKKCSFSEESLERTYVPFGCTRTRIAKFPKCLK